MPDDWAPRLVPTQRKATPDAPAIQKEAPAPVINVEVQAPALNVRGWKFVPHRDANNLIDEIIATPIVD